MPPSKRARETGEPTRETEAFTARRGLVLAAAFCLLFLVQGLLGNQLKSIGGDEPGVIAGGYAIVAWRDHAFYNFIPPLSQVLAALPLLDREIDPASVARPGSSPDVGFITAGLLLLIQSGADIPSLTFHARLPFLLLGLALVVLVYLLVGRLIGRGPALASSALVAFSPTLLAHAKVATSDVACATLMFAAVTTFFLARQRPHWTRWTLCGAVTGLALLTKYTSLLLGPIFLVLFVLEVGSRRRTGAATTPAETTALEQPLARQLGDMLLAGTVAWLVVGLGYHGRFDYGLYLEGIRRLYGDHVPGYEFFLLGDYSSQPWWWYYFAVMALKIPLGTLLLIVLGAGRALCDRRLRPPLAYLYVPAGAILLVSCFDGANVGIRRIAPALPFLMGLAGACFVGVHRHVAKASVALLCAALLEGALAFPHHLAFFNLAARSIDAGLTLADDSNIDWDLDMPALAHWQRAHAPQHRIRIFPRGHTVLGAYGENVEPITSADLLEPSPAIYAISAHQLIRLRRKQTLTGQPYDWLERFEWSARAGSSIYLFDLRGPSAGR